MGSVRGPGGRGIGRMGQEDRQARHGAGQAREGFPTTFRYHVRGWSENGVGEGVTARRRSTRGAGICVGIGVDVDVDESAGRPSHPEVPRRGSHGLA